jgi:K+-transporting ATPase ATPase A chain
MGVDQSTGSMEGKEVRLGAGLSALWAVTTTVTSNGSVNSMHDSMTPLGGLMPMVGMWLNNIFGGVGVGFINMLIFVIVAVFVAGMMIGRTPEFLGKKVEAKEMKLASLALLWHPLAILVGTGVACTVWATTADPVSALAWLKNPGPHGFSEMMYEFTSAAANSGSGFEGLGDNTPFWNISTGLVMTLVTMVMLGGGYHVLLWGIGRTLSFCWLLSRCSHLRTTPAPKSPLRCSSRCSSASFPPPSAP